MSLAGVLKEMEAKLKALKEDAMKEAQRLASLLSDRFKFARSMRGA